ncbi:CDGSH iron-sulfur domain-containing protein [Chloroflexota bacterium]
MVKDSDKTGNKPTIKVTANGPYLVKGLNDLNNSNGLPLEARPAMTLCRCGESANKPFCDGTHLRIGFRGDKNENRVPDKMDDYSGKEITIHDNRGVCAHAGFCTDNSPAVFTMKEEPWINPDADSPDKTARTIRMCPSGALSYTKDGTLYKDQARNPAIIVSKDGPYYVVGGPLLEDPGGSKPESGEHYTLCRCGGSKNKPFCNGAHWYIDFKDDKN